MSLFLNKKAVGLEYWPVVVHIFCKAKTSLYILGPARTHAYEYHSGTWAPFRYPINGHFQ